MSQDLMFLTETVISGLMAGVMYSLVALGFGLSTPEQVAEAAKVADGVVVGSARVRFLEEQPEGDLGAQVRWLTSAM